MDSNQLINILDQNHILLLTMFTGLSIFLIVFSFLKRGLGFSRNKEFFLNILNIQASHDKSKKTFTSNSIFLQKLANDYKWSNLPLPFELSLILTVLVGFLSFSLFAFIFNYNLIFSFSTIIYVIVFYILIIRILAKKNLEKISTQLPFALDTVAGALKAGYSLTQAFKFTVRETVFPLKLIFDDCVTQLDYNLSLEKVFTNIQTKTDNQELISVFDALILQNRTGGNINKVLNKMANWIRKKNKLYKDVKVFTSQGKMSGILIMLLWPFSFVIFYYMDQDYVSILFESTLGYSLLAISLFLEIIF